MTTRQRKPEQYDKARRRQKYLANKDKVTQRYQEKKKAILESRAKDYALRREEILERNKKWRDANRDAVLKQRREHYRQNIDKIKAARNQPRKRFTVARFRAKASGRKWYLTFAEYREIIKGDCAYCGRSIANETGYGLDRVECARGYEPDNIVPSCKICNRVKSNIFSFSEMKQLGHLIRSLLNQRSTTSG